MKTMNTDKKEANRDPLSGAPGSHPVGTGLGAVAGGIAAGAAAGTVAGPLGTLAGAAAGAVVGGLAGKAIGEAVDPTMEDSFWTSQYQQEPYFSEGQTYDDYGPAYRTGYEGRSRYAGRMFDDLEGGLRANFEQTKGKSRLDWMSAKPAARAAWDRVDKHGNAI